MASVRIVSGQAGQRMVQGTAGNRGAVQVRVNLTALEQKTLTAAEQRQLVLSRAKEALLEIAGRL